MLISNTEEETGRGREQGEEEAGVLFYKKKKKILLCKDVISRELRECERDFFFSYHTGLTFDE